MSELKPVRCSCGAAPIVDKAGTMEIKHHGVKFAEYAVYAVFCFACGAFTMPKRTKEAAIVAWNNGERED